MDSMYKTKFFYYVIRNVMRYVIRNVMRYVIRNVMR